MFLLLICILLIVVCIWIESIQSKKKAKKINEQIESTGLKFCKEIKIEDRFFLGISEEERKIVITKEDSQYVLNYEDILGVDFVVNGDMVLSRSVGKMIGASAIAGAAGALLVDQKAKTKVTSFYVDIRTRLLEVPSVRILPPINDYQTADEITNVIKIIIDKVEQEQKEKSIEAIQTNISQRLENENRPTATPNLLIADELSKLAALRDNGILTIEEFETQKAKLLEK